MKHCPQGLICINNMHIIYISIILLLVLYFCTNQHVSNIYKYNNEEIIKRFEDSLFKKREIDNVVNKIQNINKGINNYSSRDIGLIVNPLQPPLKRNYHFSNPSINRMPINIETRESGGDYQQVGILHKDSHIDTSFNKPGSTDDTVILGLFGKPLYKGSSNWNYYVLSHKNNLKIPLILDNNNCTDNTNGCNEINNNDTINIDQYNGSFKVQLYKFNAPKYIPYI